MQTLQDMLSASQQDLEAFLTQVYRAIAGAAPLKDKVRPIPSMPNHLLMPKMLELVWLLSWHDALVEMVTLTYRHLLLDCLVVCKDIHVQSGN